MQTATATAATTRPACDWCPKKHRVGTLCPAMIGAAYAERTVRANADQGRLVIALLERLPVGTVTLLDSRGPRATARTLAAGEALVLRYSDACADSGWGSTENSAGLVRYCADHGGGVPNAYGYAAETDRVLVVAAAGRVVIVASRVRAPSGSHGNVGNPDSMMPLNQLGLAVANGVQHNAAVVVAAKAQARIERLSAHRSTCTPAELVEIDSALESGWLVVE